nr:MAG TPA: hypothetical protein [Caudoviricetes sp.]
MVTKMQSLPMMMFLLISFNLLTSFLLFILI